MTVYNDEAIHNTFANGFPAAQGLTIKQSAEAFKAYVYTVILN